MKRTITIEAPTDERPHWLLTLTHAGGAYSRERSEEDAAKTLCRWASVKTDKAREWLEAANSGKHVVRV